MTERTDDYIKNMIRKMLREEGWVRGGEAADPGFPDGTIVHRITPDPRIWDWQP